MAGRGFRGSTARITFATTGVNKVVNSLKSIDGYFNKLSRDAETYSRIEQRIQNLQGRVSVKEDQYSLNRIKSAEKLLALQTRIFGMERDSLNREGRLALTQDNHKIESAESLVRVENARQRVVTQGLNIEKLKAKNLTAEGLANQRINKAEEQSIFRRINLLSKLRGIGYKTKEGRALISPQNIDQTVKNFDKSGGVWQKSNRTGGQERKELLQVHLRQLGEMYALNGEIKTQEAALASIRSGEMAKQIRKQSQLTAAYTNAQSRHGQLSIRQTIDVQKQIAAIDKQRNAINQLKRSHATLSATEKAQANAQLQNLNSLKASLTNLLNIQTSFTKKSAAGFNNLLSAITDNSEMMLRFAKGAAIAGASLAAIKFAKFVSDSVQVYAAVERTQAAIEALVGSAEVAKTVVDDMFALSRTMPVAPTELIEGARTLLSVGTEVKDLNRDMRSLGTIATAVNQPLTDLSVIYGEIRNKDRMYREDILQFSRRGIPLMQVFQEALGVSREELNQLVSDGAIGFDEFQAAIHRLTEEGGRFSEMNEKILGTLSGSTQVISSSMTSLMKDFGGIVVHATSFDEVMQNVANELKESAEWAAELLLAWQSIEKVKAEQAAAGSPTEQYIKAMPGFSDNKLEKDLKTYQDRLRALGGEEALWGRLKGDWTRTQIEHAMKMIDLLAREHALRKAIAEGATGPEAEKRRGNEPEKEKDALDTTAQGLKDSAGLGDATKAVESFQEGLVTEKEKYEDLLVAINKVYEAKKKEAQLKIDEEGTPEGQVTQEGMKELEKAAAEAQKKYQESVVSAQKITDEFWAALKADIATKVDPVNVESTYAYYKDLAEKGITNKDFRETLKKSTTSDAVLDKHTKQRDANWDRNQNKIAMEEAKKTLTTSTLTAPAQLDVEKQALLDAAVEKQTGLTEELRKQNAELGIQQGIWDEIDVKVAEMLAKGKDPAQVEQWEDAARAAKEAAEAAKKKKEEEQEAAKSGLTEELQQQNAELGVQKGLWDEIDVKVAEMLKAGKDPIQVEQWEDAARAMEGIEKNAAKAKEILRNLDPTVAIKEDFVDIVAANKSGAITDQQAIKALQQSAGTQSFSSQQFSSGSLSSSIQSKLSSRKDESVLELKKANELLQAFKAGNEKKIDEIISELRKGLTANAG